MCLESTTLVVDSHLELLTIGRRLGVLANRRAAFLGISKAFGPARQSGVQSRPESQTLQHTMVGWHDYKRENTARGESTEITADFVIGYLHARSGAGRTRLPDGSETMSPPTMLRIWHEVVYFVGRELQPGEVNTAGSWPVLEWVEAFVAACQLAGYYPGGEPKETKKRATALQASSWTQMARCGLVPAVVSHPYDLASACRHAHRVLLQA